jgi:hypothetical protein
MPTSAAARRNGPLQARHTGKNAAASGVHGDFQVSPAARLTLALAGLRLQTPFCAARACSHTQPGTSSGFIMLKGNGRRTGGSNVCAEGCWSACAGAVAHGDGAGGGAVAAGEGAQACPTDGSLAGAVSVVSHRSYPQVESDQRPARPLAPARGQAAGGR